MSAVEDGEKQMPKEFPEQRDPQTGHDGDYANQPSLSPADQALLESATAEATRDAADRQPGTLDDDDDLYTNVGTEPMSDITAPDATSGYDETVDGLDDLEETVRQQAEDRPIGGREDFAG